VRYYVGSYDYYLEMRERGLLPPEHKLEPELEPPQQPSAAKPRKLKWKEERELEAMESTILAAETEATRLEALFAEPDFFENHRADLQTQQANLDAARKRVAALYARWAELEGLKAGG
jgi:ATP-binding cassette subfamily F protein uup